MHRIYIDGKLIITYLCFKLNRDRQYKSIPCQSMSLPDMPEHDNNNMYQIKYYGLNHLNNAATKSEYIDKSLPGRVKQVKSKPKSHSNYWHLYLLGSNKRRSKDNSHVAKSPNMNSVSSNSSYQMLPKGITMINSIMTKNNENKISRSMMLNDPL